MVAFGISTHLIVLTVVAVLQVNCCLRLDRWIRAKSCPSFSTIKQKFLDGSITSIKNEDCVFQELKSPTLEDLSVMFNDLSAGSVPQFIIDNDYILLGNNTANYDYIKENKGGTYGTVYGLFLTDEEKISHSMLDFRFIQGSSGSFSYTVGQALFSHARYTKTDDVLSYQIWTLGGLLFKMPSGEFVLYGNYTGLSDGESAIHGDTVSHRLDTLGILDIPNQYYSRDTVYVTGNTDSSYSSQKCNVYSTTGGTNATLFFNFDIPSEGNNILMTTNGTISNSEKEVSFEQTAEIPLTVHKSHPFSDQNLPVIFSYARIAVGLYLP